MVWRSPVLPSLIECVHLPPAAPQAPTPRSAWATRWLRWRSCSPWAPRWTPPRSRQRRVLWQWHVVMDRCCADATLPRLSGLKCTAPLPSATLPAAHQQPMCRTANCAAADAVPDQGHAARVPADWGGLAGHAVPQAPQWCGGRGLPQRASRHTRNPLMRLHSEAVDCTLCRCLHPAITLSQSPFHPPSPVGILADEMGLGKTIQTIALLAHLACER